MFKAINFTSKNVRDLRREMDDVLARYTERTGVEFKVGNIRFNSQLASIKVEATLPGHTPQEEVDYLVAAPMDGITFPVGTVVTGVGLEKVRMIGYKPRNRKYPYIVEKVATGRRYKISALSAKSLILWQKPSRY